jgi:predicted RNase H-like HicB family nuclease
MKKSLQMYEFPVLIEKDGESSFFAIAPTLAGCYTSGKNFNEAVSNIHDAIALYVTDLKHEKKRVPKRKMVSFMSVEVLA